MKCLKWCSCISGSSEENEISLLENNESIYQELPQHFEEDVNDLLYRLSKDFTVDNFKDLVKEMYEDDPKKYTKIVQEFVFLYSKNDVYNLQNYVCKLLLLYAYETNEGGVRNHESAYKKLLEFQENNSTLNLSIYKKSKTKF